MRVRSEADWPPFAIYWGGYRRRRSCSVDGLFFQDYSQTMLNVYPHCLCVLLEETIYTIERWVVYLFVAKNMRIVMKGSELEDPTGLTRVLAPPVAPTAFSGRCIPSVGFTLGKNPSVRRMSSRCLLSVKKRLRLSSFD